VTAPRRPWAGSRRTVPTDWPARRRRCLLEHDGICHVCGHGGATHVDHVLNVARGGTHEPDNLRPVHGTPCPTCQRDCHGDKTKDEARAGMAKHSRKRPAEEHPGRLPRGAAASVVTQGFT
jgi:5-methylcytosine-specific restriction endonuclease McrA